MSASPLPRPAVRPIWLYLAFTGCAVVLLAFLLTALVLLDKPRFGWMVGGAFLITTGSLVIAGGLALLAAAWKLPLRARWQRVVLVLWALIAILSPWFGYLFLVPWTVLLLLLPLVGWILFTAPRPTAG